MRVFCGYGAAADVQSCVLCAPVWISASGRVILRWVYSYRRCADAADGAQSVPLRRKLSAVFAYSAVGALSCRSSFACRSTRSIGSASVGICCRRAIRGSFHIYGWTYGNRLYWRLDDPSGIFHLLEDLAEEGDDAKTELTRYFRNSLYWLVLGAGLSVRSRPRLFRFPDPQRCVLVLSAEFWNKIGSVTLVFSGSARSDPSVFRGS